MSSLPYTSSLHSRYTQWLRSCTELLASMRFAIALLSLICIASVIGTVVKQNEPLINYVNQFGPFWAEVFGSLQIYTVYSAWWFLLILAFLVISTSLCIARNTPKILHEMRNFKEHIRAQSLQAFHHKAQGMLNESPEQALQRISLWLSQNGWKAKAQLRQDENNPSASGTMIAACKGMTNKLGYLAAHGSIVLICLGGLLDGDMMVRALMSLQGKSVYTSTGWVNAIPQAHRLGPNSPSYRGHVSGPEGARRDAAILSLPGGSVVQDLPFDIELKKFIVDYYETGMPKLFSSEIVIHDHETGEAIPAVVKVNHPAQHKGILIYQSSFDDGGSLLKMRMLSLQGQANVELSGRVGTQMRLPLEDQELSLELTGLRVINVENLASAHSDEADVRKVDWAQRWSDHLGTGAKTTEAKTLRNVGPSITYRLRDSAGQAREYHNYMLPFEIEGQRSLLVGVRDNPNETFRYLRIPVDADNTIQSWLHLRSALLNPKWRALAAQRYARSATPTQQPEMTQQLEATALRALALFAGAQIENSHGLQALGQFLDKNVPTAQQARISEVLLRVLNGSLFELLNISRQQHQRPNLSPDTTTQAFMTQAVISLSDSFAYPAPILMQLDTFEHVQASVFQVARAPGKVLVYLGAVLLILGVFTMLYVRERRLWIWLNYNEGEPIQLTMALSTPRRTLELDKEFKLIQQALLMPTSSSASALPPPFSTTP